MVRIYKAAVLSSEHLQNIQLIILSPPCCCGKSIFIQGICWYQFLWVSIENVSQVKWLNPRLHETDLSKSCVNLFQQNTIIYVKKRGIMHTCKSSDLVLQLFHSPLFQLLLSFHEHLQYHLTHPDVADIAHTINQIVDSYCEVLYIFWEFSGIL